VISERLDKLVEEMVDKGVQFEDAIHELEKRFIARVLQQHRGNLSKAAKDLKIHRNTLGKKIEEFKLWPPPTLTAAASRPTLAVTGRHC